MSLVVDASVVLAVLLPDESDPYAENAIRAIGPGGALVPAGFFAETCNIFIISGRRGRLGSSSVEELIDDLLALAISQDPEPPARNIRRVVALTQMHRLTVYDAAYLELALRLGFPLATLDAELKQAALAEGVWHS